MSSGNKEWEFNLALKAIIIDNNEYYSSNKYSSQNEKVNRCRYNFSLILWLCKSWQTQF